LSLSALVFDGAGYPRALHSFPTRRSSDLAASAIRCTIVAASATLFITTTWLRTPTVPSARRYPINSGSAMDRHPSLLGLEAPHIVDVNMLTRLDVGRRDPHPLAVLDHRLPRSDRPESDFVPVRNGLPRQRHRLLAFG